MKNLVIILIAIGLSACSSLPYRPGVLISGPAPKTVAGVAHGLPNADGSTNVYTSDQCIGAIVNGICHGEVVGNPIAICHGTMLAGECIGAELPSHGAPTKTDAMPRTHEEAMRQSKPQNHDDLMCESNPYACKSTPNRTEPRTHQEAMCASNPFACE